ncbi:hypothetical protein [Metapseudomonas boanensis]|nr:hypothetical protein [Pseudomonas boanensis]
MQRHQGVPISAPYRPSHLACLIPAVIGSGVSSWLSTDSLTL